MVAGEDSYGGFCEPMSVWPKPNYYFKNIKSTFLNNFFNGFQSQITFKSKPRRNFFKKFKICPDIGGMCSPSTWPFLTLLKRL